IPLRSLSMKSLLTGEVRLTSPIGERMIRLCNVHASSGATSTSRTAPAERCCTIPSAAGSVPDVVLDDVSKKSRRGQAGKVGLVDSPTPRDEEALGPLVLAAV